MSKRRSAQHGFTPLKRPVENGFTLIEMLVALAVFALAALALLRLQAVAIRTTSELDARQLAQIVAHNIMVERLTDPVLPSLGKQAGAVENGGRRWLWNETVAPAGDAPGALRIDVVVEGAGGDGRAVLTFLRAKPS